MSTFKHYEKARVEYNDTAVWTPSAWDRSSGIPPIRFVIERPGASSARYLKAMTTKKNRFPVRAKDEPATPEFARKNRNAQINLIIMGLLANWEEVTDEAGVPVPIPALSHEDPKAAGNREARSLLRALGEDMEAELCAWVKFDWNWRVRKSEPEPDEDDEDGAEDEEELAGPLDVKSPTA